MDEECKKSFLIIFGIPTIIFLIFAWVVLGEEKIQFGWFNGFLNNLSIMWLPTLIFVIVGWIIDKFVFDDSLLNCLGKKIRKNKP